MVAIGCRKHDGRGEDTRPWSRGVAARLFHEACLRAGSVGPRNPGHENDDVMMCRSRNIERVARLKLSREDGVRDGGSELVVEGSKARRIVSARSPATGRSRRQAPGPRYEAGAVGAGAIGVTK